MENKKIIGGAIGVCVMVAMLTAGCLGGVEPDGKVYTTGELYDEILAGNITDGDRVWVTGIVTDNVLSEEEGVLNIITLDDNISAGYNNNITAPDLDIIDNTTSDWRVFSELDDVEVGDEVVMFIEIDFDGERSNTGEVTVTVSVWSDGSHWALDFGVVEE